MEEGRIHTYRIDSDSPKFMEIFLFVQRWKYKKDGDGFRHATILR